MGTEEIAGGIIGATFGFPELGSIMGGVNSVTKTIYDLTDGVPVLGDVVGAVDDASDAIKDIPVFGDVIDLIL